ncbi:hypothetical protein ACH4L9_25860 [Streptomyces globisporus]|uniref:hypothetical protein n=1 Tax=Streptomyces globisporus TaxID=1908 RepID=UPI0037981026
MQATSASVFHSTGSIGPIRDQLIGLGSLFAAFFSGPEVPLKRPLEVKRPEAFSPELHSLIERRFQLSSGNQELEDTTLRSAADAAVGVDNFSASHVLRYARQKVAELAALPVGWDGEEAPPSSSAACTRILRLLRATTSQASVYPTLVTDYEGGISAEWRAGKQKAAIEIDAAGEAYLYVTNQQGDELLADQLPMGQEAYALIRIFRHELSEMSSRVEKVNPAWRSLFE